MVQPGASLTFIVTGNGPGGLFNMTGDALRGVILEGFRSAGVRLVYFEYEHTDSFWNPETSWSYRATVTVQTLYAHAAVGDVAAIVEHVFWTAAGSAPHVTQRGVDPEPPALPAGSSVLGGVQMSLGLVALIAVAVAVIVVMK